MRLLAGILPILAILYAPIGLSHDTDRQWRSVSGPTETDRANRRAAAWHREAAERGLPEAQYILGAMYYEGKGVPQSYELAVLWYRRAAVQGMVQAQYNLGIMYLHGEGVERNERKARMWLRRAAESGYVEARVALDSM